MVDKIISPITPLGEIDKINELVDGVNNAGTVKKVNNTSPDGNGNVTISIPTVPLEGVQINGSDLTITNKKVNIPLAGTNTIGVAKANAAYGVYNNNGTLTISKATDSQVTGKSSQYRPLTPYNIDLAVKTGITTNTLTLTDTEKTAAKNWLGVSEGGGSSRNIGEIVASIIPLTDAGLHLLDGALIQGSGIYSDFVDYIAELYDNTSYIDKTFIQPTLTANGTLGGSSFAVSASAEVQSGSNPYRTYEAFDNNSSTYWRAGATTGWIEFYNPTPLKVTNLRWGYHYNYPTGGNVQGSNDGSTWTTLTTWTNSSASDFNISLSSNTNYYKYYRINITGVNTDVIHCSQINITATYQEKSAFCTEAQWQSSVTTYGVCGKFVYDSVNNTVRLPKYNSKIYTGGGTAPVVGNGMSLGFTDGSNNNYSIGGWDNNTSWLVRDPSSFGSNLPKYRSNFVGGSQVIGVTTDPDKSGIIADLSNITTSLDGYYYIVVATSTKTTIQVDIDDVVTDLNDKVNKSDLTTIQCVTDSGIIGNSWYRIWSDGWCEQGGITAPYNGNTDVTISLLYPYRSHNYSVSFALYTTDTTNESGVIRSITKNSFNFYAWGSRVVYWRTAGYMEV